MLRTPALLALALCLSGCAYRYTDGDGVTHTIGLVHVRSKAMIVGDAEARAEQVRTIGVSVLNTSSQKGLTIGYLDASSLEVLRENAAGEISFPDGSLSNFEYRNPTDPESNANDSEDTSDR